MKYPNFQSVPEGKNCKPVTVKGYGFYPKEDWIELRTGLSMKMALGEWETDEPEPVKWPEKGKWCFVKHEDFKLILRSDGKGGFGSLIHESIGGSLQSFTEVSHVVLKDGTIMCGCGGTEWGKIISFYGDMGGVPQIGYIKCKSCGQVIEE